MPEQRGYARRMNVDPPQLGLDEFIVEMSREPVSTLAHERFMELARPLMNVREYAHMPLHTALRAVAKC